MCYVLLAAGTGFAKIKALKALLLLAALSCTAAGWYAAFRRYHLIVDTPTSLVVSAAQGYVELFGRCELHRNTLPLGFLSGPPCVWQSYSVYEQTGSQLRLVSSGRTNDTFLLRDATGTCVIDPEQAEFVGASHKRWKADGYIYQVDYLAPGQVVYALGLLSSQQRTMEQSERGQMLSSVLGEWKRDRPTLLQRFDANGDGTLDLREWDTVREAAALEVEKLGNEAAAEPDLHILHNPADGRPFILSNRPPCAVASRYWCWACLHGVGFLAAGMTAIVALS